MTPYIHAELSAKRFGGQPGDYLDIHVLMDSTKSTFGDNRHRALTHNCWFTTTVLPLCFGHIRENSDGRRYSVKDVGEYHVLEDYRFKYLPSVGDYLECMRLMPWMNNGIGNLPSRIRNHEPRESPLPESPLPESALPDTTVID